MDTSTAAYPGGRQPWFGRSTQLGVLLLSHGKRRHFGNQRPQAHQRGKLVLVRLDLADLGRKLLGGLNQARPAAVPRGIRIKHLVNFGVVGNGIFGESVHNLHPLLRQETSIDPWQVEYKDIGTERTSTARDLVK